MLEEKIDMLIVPSEDEHSSEYPADRDKKRYFNIIFVY
jgi:hypothetical protein